ncbi:MAG: hypothetical protein AB1816_08725 [Bacillota bacterium]
MISVRRALLSAVLALVLGLAVCMPALADYQLPDGSTVHWAGGNDIVVTDKDGNEIYRGPGVQAKDAQGNDRLLPPDLSSETRDYVLNETTPTTIGLGGARPGGESSASSGGGSSVPTQTGTAPTNPYAHLGMTYTGMQPISVTLSNGQQMTGYANTYEVWDAVQQKSIGYSAIPVSSDIGQALKNAHFQLDPTGTWVLIHYGAPGAQVGWTPETESIGPSFANVSSAWPENPNPSGGYINITLPSSGGWSSGGGSSGGGGSYTPQPNPYVPPPDTRKLVAYPELPVIKVGGMVPLVAEVTGVCRQVMAFAGWGGSAVLEPSADGKFRGVLQVPVNARPGVYPLVFEAVVGQVGYADRLFTVSGMLTVQAQGGGDAGAVPPAPGEEPDWWTPPEYQSP